MNKRMKLAPLVCLALLACALMFTACDSGNEPQTPSGTTNGNATEDSTTDGATESETEAHVHSFGEWTTVKEAKCDEAGLSQRWCSECYYTESNAIASKGHTKEIIPAKNATCTTYGTKEGFNCTTCGIVEIPVDYASLPTHHALTKNGANFKCSICENASDYVVGWRQFYTDYAPSDEYNMGNALNDYDRYDLIVPTHNYITSIIPVLFKDSRLEAITMTENILSIGESAFENCTDLKYVSLTNSVAKIESRAFANCENLLCVKFNGTKAEWGAIEKAPDWDAGTSNYTVYCSDGTITK